MKEIFNNEQEPKLTKEAVKKFTTGKWDMTFDWIAKELGAKTEKDRKILEGILDELEEEDWISKSSIVKVPDKPDMPDEYDPGSAQEAFY